MDIAFLFPPGGERPEFQHHLGTAYIQTYLQQWGVVSTQVVPELGSTLEECVDTILAAGAPLVGFTCFDNSYYLVRSLASRLKKRRPELRILAGGPSATFSDELILTNSPAVDLCVRFEGEETVSELAPRLLRGDSLESLSDVPGISFRRDGAIVRTPDRPLTRNGPPGGELDVLPSPYLSGILTGTEGTGILTARGCTHHCTYCNFSAMTRHTIGYHSVERVIAELQHIRNALESATDLPPDRGLISIHDDAFTLNAPRAKQICRRIIECDLRLPLTCMCRADNLDDELVSLLKEAGFLEISFGLESASPKVLRNIKKVCHLPPRQSGEDYAPETRYLARVRDGVGLARQHGLRISFSIILGLPGETPDDGRRTMEFVRELNPDSFMQNFLVAFPGTEVFETAAGYGIEVSPSEHLLPHRTIHAYPVSDIPPDEKSSFERLARLAARNVVRTLCSGALLRFGQKSGIASAMVLSSEAEALERALVWLREWLAVCGVVYVLGNAATDDSDFRRLFAASARTGVPTREAYCFRDRPRWGAAAVYQPVPEHVAWWPFRFPVVPLAGRAQFFSEAGEPRAHDWLVYSLSRREDVDFLAAIACVSPGADSGGLLDGAVVDGCRWCGSRCPAPELRRVVITATGEVKPCLTGPVIGTLEDTPAVLRANARAALTDAERQRGCADCAVTACSRCLLTFPLETGEFCALRREYPAAARIVTRSNLTHTYHPGDS